MNLLSRLLPKILPPALTSWMPLTFRVLPECLPASLLGLQGLRGVPEWVSLLVQFLGRNGLWVAPGGGMSMSPLGPSSEALGEPFLETSLLGTIYFIIGTISKTLTYTS